MVYMSPGLHKELLRRAGEDFLEYCCTYRERLLSFTLGVACDQVRTATAGWTRFEKTRQIDYYTFQFRFDKWPELRGLPPLSMEALPHLLGEDGNFVIELPSLLFGLPKRHEETTNA